MKFEEAVKLVRATKVDDSAKNSVRKGLQILEKYAEDVPVSYGGGILFASPFKARITRKDVRALGVLGWSLLDNSSWQPSVTSEAHGTPDLRVHPQIWGFLI